KPTDCTHGRSTQYSMRGKSEWDETVVNCISKIGSSNGVSLLIPSLGKNKTSGEKASRTSRGRERVAVRPFHDRSSLSQLRPISSFIDRHSVTVPTSGG
ncbi:hypothetical protein PFISCL1PPCAC_24817, partial [Pristionchus fissidentatus]